MTKEELKQKFSNLYEKRKSFCEKHTNFVERIDFSRWQKNEFFQYFYKGMKELEKENAELMSIAEFQQGGNMDRHFQLKRKKQELDKAKKIITYLLQYPYHANEADFLNHIAEAEAFLKEVSE